MYVKMYAINEAKNEFERDRIIEGVSAEAFAAARHEARLECDHDGDMLADLHDGNDDIVDVLVFSRQMRDRVVAKLKPSH